MYEFSFGAFFIGLIVLALGAVGVIYHQKIADNFGNGAGSYDRYKLYALIMCGVGVAVMLSLHTIPINWLIDSIFNI